MADLAVTNTKVLLSTTEYAPVPNAADVDVADATQKFVITPDKGDGKTIVRITVGPTNGAVAYSIGAGEFWMGTVAKTGSIAQSTTKVIQLGSSRYMKKNGTYEITFTPAAGKKLKTDHALSIEVDSLL